MGEDRCFPSVVFFSSHDFLMRLKVLISDLDTLVPGESLVSVLSSGEKHRTGAF